MPDRKNEIVDLFVRDLDTIELPPRERWRPTPRKESSLMKTSRYVLVAAAAAAVLVAALIVGLGLRDRGSEVAATPSPIPATGTPLPTSSPPATAPSPGPTASAARDIFCGVLSANTITSGQGSGADTFELRPAMSERTGTISSERLGGWVAGRPPLGTYVCVWLAQRIPIGAFESEVKPGDPGYLRTIVPNGYVLPPTCHYVDQPSSPSGTDPAVVWRFNCGADDNRDARGALRASLTTQGWVSCASGLGTEVWRKDTSRLTVSESSGAAGETPTLTQRLYLSGGGGPPNAGCQ